MANGKGHAAAANVVIVAGSITAAAAIGAGVLHPLPAAILVSGLVIGKYANPDVRDQEDVRNHAEHLIDKHFGCLVGWLWTLLWYPFATRIKHRNWRSHLPGIATFFAWLWLFLVPLVACAIFVPSWFDIALVVALLTLPGWAVQDLVHLAQDGWRWKW